MTTTATSTPPSQGIPLAAARKALLQWRLLVLWLAALLLPTLLLVFPLWRSLASVLDYSVHASQWAHQIDVFVLADVANRLTDNGMALGQAGFTAALLTLLLSPFLNGAILTAARTDTPAGFGPLIQGGVRLYGRLLRMTVWSVVPLGVAAGLGSIGMHWVEKFGDKAILESDVELYGRMALCAMAILLVLAHITVDAGRAQLALFSKRTSAVKAWWRGLHTLRHNFWRMLGGYLVLTVLGLSVAAAITVLRIALPQLGVLWMLLGLVLAQLAVAAIAWMRIARLQALVAQSRS